MAATKKATKKAPALTVQREDSWENPLTGFGTSRDKMTAGRYIPDIPLNLSWWELDALYYGNDIAAKVVDAVVDDGFRKGYCLDLGDPELSEDFQEWACDTFDIDTKLTKGFKWGRLFGGAILIVGADDGQEMDQPLNLNRVRDVTWVLPMDSRFVMPNSLYSGLGPKLGQVEKYIVTAQTGYSSTQFTVHESRVIRFGGIPVDWQMARRLNFWDLTVLQRAYDTLRVFDQSFQAAASLLTDASQGVFKIQGLINMMASNQRQKLVDRMQLVDMSRSVARSVLLDAEKEDFTKVATSFSGVPDMLDRFMQRLSAATGVPVSILMGRSAAGMNATGDLDLAAWYQVVSTYQVQTMAPIMRRLFSILAMAKSAPTKGKLVERVGVKFHPLYVPSEKERADTYKTQADGDQVYINAGVLDPAQVAIARFGRGGDEVSAAPPEVDVDALQAELKAKATFDPPGKDTPEAAEQDQGGDTTEGGTDAPSETDTYGG